MIERLGDRTCCGKGEQGEGGDPKGRLDRETELEIEKVGEILPCMVRGRYQRQDRKKKERNFEGQ